MVSCTSESCHTFTLCDGGGSESVMRSWRELLENLLERISTLIKEPKEVVTLPLLTVETMAGMSRYTTRRPADDFPLSCGAFDVIDVLLS